ncbi:hypothetical protein Bbelb_036150 [Branchiostoma belcheri]|nr:hypothetical protein Bbelb_036150 [Branchiostoma belcheri]
MENSKIALQITAKPAKIAQQINGKLAVETRHTTTEDAIKQSPQGGGRQTAAGRESRTMRCGGKNYKSDPITCNMPTQIEPSDSQHKDRKIPNKAGIPPGAKTPHTRYREIY